MKLNVKLNGTDKNPYAIFGLTQNPFPQTADARYDLACLHMQYLAGPPIPKDNAEQYIRDVLRAFSKEFVDLCVSKYKPGEYVEFDVHFPEGTG